MFIAALFIIARSWKEPRCSSVDEWIQNSLYFYTMEYYSAIRNNDLTKFLRKWLHLENIILSEITQSQKNRHNIVTNNWMLTPEISEHPRNNTQTIWSSRKNRPKQKRKKENENPLCLIFTCQENFDYFQITSCFTCTLCTF